MPDQYSNTRRAEPILSELELYSEYRNCERWAIIVGISRYRYQGWNLRYADRDAEELYNLLLTPSGGNFKKEFICKLTNEEATTGNITRALRAFLKKPAREDLVVIYFACHGAPDFDRPGNVYLLTHDTAPDDIAGTALPMREIDLSLKENLHAEKVIVLADTCHSAAIGGGIGRRSAVDDSTFVNRYLQEVSRARGGIALLTSAEANEVSFEDARWGGGHGVFTHYLLEGMRGAADRDGNGIVTVGELFEYVRDNVKRATDYRQHPLIGANAYDRNLPMAIAPGTNFSKTPEDYQQRYQEPSYTPRSEPRQAVAESFDLTLELWLTAEEMTKGTEKPVFTGQEDITVKIPAGVSSGKRIRVRGKGKFNARTRQRGDLYLLLKVQENLDITFEIALTTKEMSAGTEKHIVTEQGGITVKIPAGVSPGKRIRVRGKGRLNFYTQQQGDLYLLITQGSTARREQNTSFQQEAKFFVENLGNGVMLEMVSIPGGTFTMGQTDREKQQLVQQLGEVKYQRWFAYELPQHRVTVQPFFMGKFAVTQVQWKAVAGLPKVHQDLNPDPSQFKGNNRPVVQVSWYEVVEFCDRLSQKTGRHYCLPSEAEWEYACRAGTTTPFSCGETITTDQANYDGNHIYGSGTTGVYRQETTEVGSFPRNGFSLYDMHGNVLEWCADYWHENYEGAPTDGSAWITGENPDCTPRRMVRGGSWRSLPSYCRSATRNCNGIFDRNFDLGFRVVCGLA